MLAPTLNQSVDAVHHFSDTRSSISVWPSTSPPRSAHRVCRRFKDIIDVSLELQYRIGLAFDGMIDGPPSPLSTGERLSRLRSLRRAWSTLSCTSTVTVPMPGPCYAYELVGGIFCKTQDIQRHQRLGSRRFSVTWLPSSHNPGHTLVHEDVGIPSRDFAMDPSQDLMVLFRGGEEFVMMPFIMVVPGTLELYVRTISTNQVHPEAQVEVLRTPVLFPITTATIHIVDDIVGVLYCLESIQPHVIMWNWKTGNLIVDRGNIDLPPATSDISFITNRTFFLTCGRGSGSIEIFALPCDRSSSDAFRPPEPPVHVATHTGPFLADCPRDKPFTASNEDRIHVLTVQYVNPAPTEGPRVGPRLCVFLQNQVLEGYIRRHARSGVVPFDVHWEEWGPANTRVLLHDGMFKWLRYVHGQRVVLTSALESGRSRIKVLDFNIRDVGPRQYTTPDPDSNARCGLSMDPLPAADSGSCHAACSHSHGVLVDYPTRIEMPNFFAGSVESCLPYRETRRDEMAEYSGVMIDDERLVGLKDGAFSAGDMKEIDVYMM
ncbi:hypothetical protein BU15DRAFT_89346 [Melanogaster broomeanus]|nr:hypothetical protein BU15DRAFT_89346 [Melanogaster broomeanus]